MCCMKPSCIVIFIVVWRWFVSGGAGSERGQWCGNETDCSAAGAGGNMTIITIIPGEI